MDAAGLGGPSVFLEGATKHKASRNGSRWTTFCLVRSGDEKACIIPCDFIVTVVHGALAGASERHHYHVHREVIRWGFGMFSALLDFDPTAKRVELHPLRVGFSMRHALLFPILELLYRCATFGPSRNSARTEKKKDNEHMKETKAENVSTRKDAAESGEEPIDGLLCAMERSAWTPERILESVSLLSYLAAAPCEDGCDRFLKRALVKRERFVCRYLEGDRVRWPAMRQYRGNRLHYTYTLVGLGGEIGLMLATATGGRTPAPSLSSSAGLWEPRITDQQLDALNALDDTSFRDSVMVLIGRARAQYETCPEQKSEPSLAGGWLLLADKYGWNHLREACTASLTAHLDVLRLCKCGYVDHHTKESVPDFLPRLSMSGFRSFTVALLTRAHDPTHLLYAKTSERKNP